MRTPLYASYYYYAANKTLSLSFKLYRCRSIVDVFKVCCADGFGSVLSLATLILVVVVAQVFKLFSSDF